LTSGLGGQGRHETKPAVSIRKESRQRQDI
jgi:hypothetical protein